MQLDSTSKEIQQQVTLYEGGFLVPFPPTHMSLLISLYQRERLSDLTASQIMELRGTKNPNLLLSRQFSFRLQTSNKRTFQQLPALERTVLTEMAGI